MDSVVSWLVFTILGIMGAVKFFFSALEERERNKDS